MLEVKQVTKRYTDNSRKGSVLVLEDFSLAIGDGETVALIGESGSGKVPWRVLSAVFKNRL